MTNEPPPLILLPGLGADSRIWTPQFTAFPHLIAPDFIPAKSGETLSDYADRFAGDLAARHDLSRPFFLGGVSFGGMVAVEMTRRLKPAAVLLVAACRSRRQISRPFRLAERAVQWLPDRLGRALADGPVPWLFSKLERLDAASQQLLTDIARDADVAQVKWQAQSIAGWDGEWPTDVPVRSIHGRLDRVIPLKSIRADEVIDDGRHLINLTHAGRVNAFLARAMREAVPK